MTEVDRVAPDNERYSDMTVFSAEGTRVGLVVCRRCGSAILIDPRDDVTAPDRHDDWHTYLERDYR